MFLFVFKAKKDIQRVLDGKPWHFDKQILVLTKVSGEEQLS